MFSRFFQYVLAMGLLNSMAALVAPLVLGPWLVVGAVSFYYFFDLCNCPSSVSHMACINHAYYLFLLVLIGSCLIGLETWLLTKSSDFEHFRTETHAPLSCQRIPQYYVMFKNLPAAPFLLALLLEWGNEAALTGYAFFGIGLVFVWYKLFPRQEVDAWPLVRDLYVGYFVFVCLMSPLMALACSCNSTLTRIESRMHQFQAIMDTYAQKHQGKYPASPQSFENFARQQNSRWDSQENDIVGLKGQPYIWQSYSVKGIKTISTRESKPFASVDFYFLGIHFFTPPSHPPDCRGQILIEFSPNTYYIYGCDQHGELIQNHGKPFALRPVSATFNSSAPINIFSSYPQYAPKGYSHLMGENKR